MRAAVRNRVGAGLLAASLLLLAAPTSAGEISPEPAPAEGCGSASEESPVLVEVSTLLPRAPSLPEEPFQVAGRLRNCGQASLTGLQVRLSVGSRISTRGELQRADEEPVIGSRRLLTVPTDLEELAPGESAPFDLRMLVGDLRLGSGLGVYPLTVQARARYGDDGARTVVGLAATYVPWFPDGPPAPTRVAWLWPLIDQPRRGPAEVMLDDELDELVAPGGQGQPRGRLQELLVAAREGSAGACDQAAAPPEGVARRSLAGCRGEPVPVTYGLDPSLLYSVEAMVRDYTVLVDGERRNRPPSANAEQWLVALREAAQRQDVLALPFGDPDVVAMARADTGLRDEVEQLRKLGQATVQRLLYPEGSSRRPLTSVAWPPPGPVTDPALDLLLGGQARSVVLDVAALPPASAARNRTPSTRTALPSPYGATTGLVVEDVLSDLVTPDPVGWQGPRLAEQRFIAETAIIAAELPSQSRTLLIAPERTGSVAQAALGAAMITDTGRLPWLCPVSLAAVAAGSERCSGLPDAQGPSPAEELTDEEVTAEPEERGDELSSAFLSRLAEVQEDADQFTGSVLVDRTVESTRTKARLLRAHGRAASAAWRDQPVLGDRMLRLLQEDVADLRSKVRLVSEPVTLTGDTGVLELSVQNELDQAVNVGVRLDQTSSARLSSGDTGVQVVPARYATQIQVRVEPQTSGRFVVEATLVDEEGRAFGDPVELDVRSTQYGRVALGVTGVAAAVLMVAAGARIARRALRRPTDDPA